MKMKNEQMNMSIRVCGIFFFILCVNMVIPFESVAQSLSDFDAAMGDEVSIFKTIAKRVLEVIFIAGILGVVWAYASKDQNAKQYLTYYIIAIVLGGIGRAVLLT